MKDRNYKKRWNNNLNRSFNGKDSKRKTILYYIQKANDLSNYNVVSVAANDYKIQNGILYISYDGRNDNRSTRRFFKW